MNILFRRCSQPGKLTTTFFFNFFPTEASDDVCQAPKGSSWKTSESTEELIHKNQDGIWTGEREKVSQTLLLGDLQRQQPWWEQVPSPCWGSSVSGHPALRRGLCAQGCTYCHMGICWIKGMVSEHLRTKKSQDSECIGGLELVLHQRDAPTYLEVRPLVGKDSKCTQVVIQTPL